MRGWPWLQLAITIELRSYTQVGFIIDFGYLNNQICKSEDSSKEFDLGIKTKTWKLYNVQSISEICCSWQKSCFQNTWSIQKQHFYTWISPSARIYSSCLCCCSSDYCMYFCYCLEICGFPCCLRNPCENTRARRWRTMAALAPTRTSFLKQLLMAKSSW